MFNGMIRPDTGIMLFDNEPIRYDITSLRQIRRRVGFVLQNPDRQIIAPTVYQDVAFGPTNLGYDEPAVREAVATALRQVGLVGFERRPPHQLSGGEKKRVAIAGVLAMDPDVLVFDEPTSGLDPSGSEDLMELLDELNHDGKTIVISTHDVELVYPWAERAILLADGQIIREDVPDVAFGNTKYSPHGTPFCPDPARTFGGTCEARIYRPKAEAPERARHGPYHRESCQWLLLSPGAGHHYGLQHRRGGCIRAPCLDKCPARYRCRGNGDAGKAVCCNGADSAGVHVWGYRQVHPPGAAGKRLADPDNRQHGQPGCRTG